MKAQLIGWVRFHSEKKDKDYVRLMFVGDQIPDDRGNGLFVKEVIVSPDIVPDDLKAGVVEVEKSPWSEYINGIKNVEEKK